MACWPQGLESHSAYACSFHGRKALALWRHLCDAAHGRHSTAPSERQGTDAALSVLKEMSASAPVVPRELGFKETAVSPHIFDVMGSTGRWYLEEEQQRMRRGPENVEDATLSQVYNDPVLKRNQLCASPSCEMCNHVVRWPQLAPRWNTLVCFCSQIQREVAFDVGRETFERPLSASSWLQQASDESKFPCLKVSRWDRL